MIQKTLKILAIFIFLLSILYALFGYLVAPWAVMRYGPSAIQTLLGRDVMFGAVNVNPFLFTADIKDIRVGDEKAPLVTVNRLHIDMNAIGSLRGTWTVDDLMAEGLTLNLLRRKDGTLDIKDILGRFASEKKTNSSAVRVNIHRVSIPQASVRFTDLSGQETATANIVGINFAGTNLSTVSDRAGAYELQAKLPQNGLLKASGEVVFHPSLEINGSMSLSALNASWLWPFVRDSVTLSNVKGTIDFSIAYAYDAVKSLRLEKLELTASDIQAAMESQPLLTMKRISLSGGQLRLADQRFVLLKLAVEEGQVAAEMDSRGRLDWSRILAGPKDLTPTLKTEPDLSATPDRGEWKIAVEKFHVERVAIHLLDRRQRYPVSLDVGNVAADLGWSLTSGTNLQVVADNIGLTLSGLHLRSEGTREALATVETVSLQQGRLNFQEKQFTADSLKVEGGRTAVVRRADGGIQIVDLLRIGAAGVSETKESTRLTSVTNANDWHYHVGIMQLGGFSLELVDRTFTPAVAYNMTLQSATLKNITDKTDAQIQFDMNVAVLQGGVLQATGSVARDGSRGQAEVKVNNLALGPLRPVIQSYSGLALHSSPLSSAGHFQFARQRQGPPALQVDKLTVSLANVKLSRPTDTRHLLLLKEFELAGGAFDSMKRRVELQRIKLSGGDASVVIAHDGSVNWQEPVQQGTATDTGKRNVGNDDVAAGLPWRVNVHTLAFETLGLHVVDRSRAKPVEVDIARVDAQLKLGLEVGKAPLQVVVDDLNAQIKAVGMVSPDTSQPKLLTIESAAIQNGHADLRQKEIGAATVKLQGGQGRIVRDARGRFELAQLLTPTSSQQANPATAPPHSNWQYSFGSTQVDRFDFQYVDRSMQPAITADGRLSASIRTVSNRSEATFSVQVALGQGGTISLQGTANPAQEAVQAKVDAQSIALVPFNAFLRQRAAVDLTSGTANASATLNYRHAKQADLRIVATLQVDDLLLAEANSGDRLLFWKQLNSDGIEFDLNARSMRIASIDIASPGAKIEIAKDRTVNLAKVILAGGNGRKKSESSEISKQVEGDALPFGIMLGKLRFSDGTIDFSDQSLVLPFATKITDFGGSIVDISSVTGHRAEVSAKGTIQKYGSARVEGSIVPFDPALFTNLRVRFNNVRVKPLSPYTATFAGRTVESGKLWLDLAYDIEDGNLKGKNTVRLADFTLGEKVEAANAVNLPLNLAVALLTDSKGEIKLSVPVLGNLENPRFSFADAIRQAIGKTLQRVVTAPFRLLSRLLGGSGEDLASIDFAPGSTKLRPEQHEKLDQLIQAFRERPKLRVVVSAPYDAKVDEEALRRVKARFVLAQLEGENPSPNDDLGPIAFGNSKTQASLERLLRRQAPDVAMNLLRDDQTSDESQIALYHRIYERIVESSPLAEGATQQLAAGRAKEIAGYLQRQGLDQEKIQTGSIAKVTLTEDGSVPAQLELEGR